MTTPADMSLADGFCVLVNHEEQYSIWPARKAIPDGWINVFQGSRADCLAHVEEVWTDMRPKSLRDQMAG